MDGRKRTWIWGGLGLATDAVLVTPRRAASAGIAGLSAARPARARIGRGSRVLLVGDETAAGLYLPLRQMAQDHDAVLRGRAEPGTSIEDWASQALLASELRVFSPTVVLVCLGLHRGRPAARNGATASAPATPVPLSCHVPLVWVAPPVEDAELRAVLSELPIEVFPSYELVLPRGAAGIYPTAIGYAGWAGALWRWLS